MNLKNLGTKNFEFKSIRSQILSKKLGTNEVRFKKIVSIKKYW